MGEVKHGLDNPCSSGSDDAERVHMRHDIVPPLLFFLSGDLELLPVEILHKNHPTYK